MFKIDASALFKFISKCRNNITTTFKVSDMFDWFIQVIFWCIHLALEIRYRIGLCWKILVEITMGMYYTEPGPVELKNKTKHFQKIPKHMGFILDSSQIDYKKLARIICWSAALGIHFLTIFDGQGKILNYILTKIIELSLIY